MILVDLSQIAISHLAIQFQSGLGTPNPGVVDEKEPQELNEDLVRHTVLNSLRLYRTKFREKFGEIVLCCDNQRYWRKDVFPYYKAGRKKDRENSPLDWRLIFDTIRKLRVEFAEFLPYRIFDVAGAEADDIIAVLSKMNHTAEKVLILSGDHDFRQLHKYPNIFQYAPIQKTYVKEENPIVFLRAQIMSGDRGDGVPNFLSPDNSLADGIRQKTLKKDNLERWSREPKPENFCDPRMLRGYKRNQELIDFDYIPKDIQDEIKLAWDDSKPGSRKHIFEYFCKFKLVELMDNIGEF